MVSLPASIAPIAFHLDFSSFLAFDIEYYIVVFAMLFMDLFDTIGSLIGTSASVGMIDPKTGHVKGLNRALMADAVGTTFGAFCGSSTVTTFVESTTGIAAGGRTGLTSFSVAMFFLVALFFSPLFLLIPSAATTSALVLVGVLMMNTIKKIDFSDFTEIVPCFITIVMMPFANSISEGIVLGMLSYVFIKVMADRRHEVSLVMYILSAFFLLKYIAPLL